MNESQIAQAKGYFWAAAAIFLVGLFFCMVFVGVPALKEYSDALVSPRTMTVSADGKATLTPDTAETSFSIISRGVDPQALATDNNGKIGSVVDFLKSQGLQDKDITTTGYDLSPNYQYNPKTGANFISGYTLTQTVTVKIHDLTKVAAILGGLTPLGINQIGGVNFTVDDPDQYLASARADAFGKARAKAESMAEEVGASIGRVVSAQESEGGMPGPVYPMAMSAAGGMEAPSVPAPTIEPGSQDVTLTVSVTYELR